MELALGDNQTSNAKGKLCKADEFVLLLYGLFHTIQVTCVKDFKNLNNRLDQVQNFNIRSLMAIKAVWRNEFHRNSEFQSRS